MFRFVKSSEKSRSMGACLLRYCKVTSKCWRETQPGMVAHACSASTQEGEAEGLRVWGKPGLQSKTLWERERERERDPVYNTITPRLNIRKYGFSFLLTDFYLI
jgi:hypothetical protein